MPWQTNRPRGPNVNPRYHNRAHRQTRAQLIAQLEHDGTGRCAEPNCRYRTRTITPDMDLHLSHDRTTGRVLGLSHRQCNIAEAARYARAKQGHTQASSRLRW